MFSLAFSAAAFALADVLHSHFVRGTLQAPVAKYTLALVPCRMPFSMQKNRCQTSVENVPARSCSTGWRKRCSSSLQSKAGAILGLHWSPEAQHSNHDRNSRMRAAIQ